MFDTDRRGAFLGAGIEGVSSVSHSHEQIQQFVGLPDLEITPVYPKSNTNLTQHLQNYLKKKGALASEYFIRSLFDRFLNHYFQKIKLISQSCFKISPL